MSSLNWFWSQSFHYFSSCISHFLACSKASFNIHSYFFLVDSSYSISSGRMFRQSIFPISENFHFASYNMPASLFCISTASYELEDPGPFWLLINLFPFPFSMDLFFHFFVRFCIWASYSLISDIDVLSFPLSLPLFGERAVVNFFY